MPRTQGLPFITSSLHSTCGCGTRTGGRATRLDGGPLGPLSWVFCLLLGTVAYDLIATRNTRKIIVGCLAWGIPLVIASGGVDAYLAALHTQAAEDFSWVDMLWSNPTPRRSLRNLTGCRMWWVQLAACPRRMGTLGGAPCWMDTC